MKEIIYNYDNLEEREISNTVVRTKMLIINSKQEILLAHSSNNYHIVGGHLEQGETLEECIVREVKEETGITIKEEVRKPFFAIKYMCRDYPKEKQNTLYIANYYALITDQKPNEEEMNLTENELEGILELKYIHKDKILNVLNDALETCENKNVILDTIEVVTEYLKQNQ